MSLREAVLSHPLFTKTRLYSLYSDFRKLKEANPDGFEANLIAWKSLIDEFFQKGLFSHWFVLDTDGLMEELVLPEYGKPMALDFVLDELIKCGDLIPLKSFENESIYAKKWVKPLLTWAVDKFIMDTSYKVGDKKNNLKSDRLISKKVLESYVFELLEKINKESDKSKLLFDRIQFKKYIESLNIKINGKAPKLTDLDYEILLKYLNREKPKLNFNDEIIKFSLDEITEQDEAIVQLKTTIEDSHLKSEELNDKINLLDIKIKESLKSKNRELAKNLLRSKKIAQDSLIKQIETINQLDSVLFKIDEASSNIQLLNALEIGASLLKSLNNEIGGVERVEEIMDEIIDEKTKTDEISQEINKLSTPIDGIDEEEIDQEYEEMLKQATTGKDEAVDEIAKKLEGLKVAPTTINTEEKKQAIHN